MCSVVLMSCHVFITGFLGMTVELVSIIIAVQHFTKALRNQFFIEISFFYPFTTILPLEECVLLM